MNTFFFTHRFYSSSFEVKKKIIIEAVRLYLQWCSLLATQQLDTQHFALAHRFFYRRSATLIVPNSVIWIDDLHLIEFNWRHEGEGKSIDAMKNWCAIGRELNEFSMNNWVYINFGWRERGRTHWSQSHTNYIIVIRNEQTPTCQLVYVSNECVWASDES